MRPIYFRVTEPPDPTVFDDVWHEIPPTTNQFFLGRKLWRANQVSRSDRECAVLRFHFQDQAWELKNNAPGRMVVLVDGQVRSELLTGMTAELVGGPWRGSLTHAFTFEITLDRPAERVVVFDGYERAATGLGGQTQSGLPVTLARDYLDKFRHKRLALAFLWRQHIEHTPGHPRDLTSEEVGAAFGENPKAITTWRSELAAAVYGRSGFQHAVRDLVIKSRLLTAQDVADADRWVRQHGPGVRRPPAPPPRSAGQGGPASSKGVSASWPTPPPR